MQQNAVLGSFICTFINHNAPYVSDDDIQQQHSNTNREASCTLLRQAFDIEADIGLGITMVKLRLDASIQDAGKHAKGTSLAPVFYVVWQEQSLALRNYMRVPQASIVSRAHKDPTALSTRSQLRTVRFESCTIAARLGHPSCCHCMIGMEQGVMGTSQAERLTMRELVTGLVPSHQ